MRTTYDIEMMRQVGSCSGIENYSRHIDGRAAGSAPNTLLDYFPEDFLLVIDESHYCKNTKAKRTKAVARLAAAVSSTSERRAQRVWLARRLFCVWLMI